ncbi:MAG: nuclear transport factor 2 family protein [Bacteroidota bacterium]
MKRNPLTLIALTLSILLTMAYEACATMSPQTKGELEAAAEQFIKVVDANDAESLTQLLHPQMLQYVQLGGDLIPFKAADFIQMVADKKIGGVPRKISHHSANIVRGKTANVIVNAVSEEYDFMYQLSMVKTADQWLIVGILVDITKPG